MAEGEEGRARIELSVLYQQEQGGRGEKGQLCKADFERRQGGEEDQTLSRRALKIHFFLPMYMGRETPFTFLQVNLPPTDAAALPG